MTAKEFFTNEMEKQWQERTSAFSSDFGSLSRIPYVVHPAIYKVMEGYATEQLKQERNKAIDVQKILTNSEGSNHLKWIYDRMIYVLGENPNMDYMHKFKSIIEKLTAQGEH